MPYTKEELETYQYYLNRVEDQRQKYQDYLDDQNISQTSERNHLVASGSDVLISFDLIILSSSLLSNIGMSVLSPLIRLFIVESARSTS